MAARTSFIDLSHPLESDMPVFPGSKPVIVMRESLLNKDQFNETALQITTHTGTHIDCSSHMLTEGDDTMTLSLDSFFGPGICIDCHSFASGSFITKKLLKQHAAKFESVDFVLLYTGWDRYWGHPRYFNGFPVLNEEAAEYLTGFRLKGLGCDTISFDPSDSLYFPVHHKILSSRMILIENLTNLDRMPGSSFIFSCFPLRIKNGDGSPVRAVAITGMCD